MLLLCQKITHLEVKGYLTILMLKCPDLSYAKYQKVSWLQLALSGCFRGICLHTYIYCMIIHFLCPPLCCLFLLFDYLTFRLPRSSQQLVFKGRYPSALEKSFISFIQELVLSLDLNQPQNLLWGQQKHQLHHRLQHLQQVPQQNRPVALLLSQLAEQHQVETFKTMFTIF